MFVIFLMMAIVTDVKSYFNHTFYFLYILCLTFEMLVVQCVFSVVVEMR